jgi:4-amino-4-deoxy-L-arabinose transferase-like glycosyltransferase
LFGLQSQTWILVFFSTLTVMSVYFITRRITGGHLAGLCAAFLLAINPGHAYFATFPVSETIAGFFFLAALYLLLDKRFFGFLLPLAALFLTRITGFITAPLLLVSLLWMALRRRDSRPLWAGLGVLAVYAVSFYWGLEFSPHYSFDIYKSKLGIGRGALHYAGAMFLGIGIVWVVIGYIAVRQGERLSGGLRWVSRYRYAVSGSLVMIVIAMCAYRGYLLAFTDHYQHHRWYSQRWKMAGLGIPSLSYLSVNTLRLLLSPPGVVAFVIGLIVLGASACRRSVVAPVAILTVGFSCVFLSGQLTTPITYYFARYLVSELVPLACICSVIALESVRRAFPRWGSLVFPVYGACVLFSVWPALIGRMSATEGEGLSRAVQCLDKITGPDSVLLVDRQKLPLGAYSYTTPLRLGFGKRTYTVLFKDFANQPAKLDALVSFFRQKNLQVFLLSSNPQWLGRSQFTHVRTLHITQERLLARRRLPTRFTQRKRTVRMYAQRPLERVSGVCEWAGR